MMKIKTEKFPENARRKIRVIYQIREKSKKSGSRPAHLRRVFARISTKESAPNFAKKPVKTEQTSTEVRGLRRLLRIAWTISCRRWRLC
jgi:hypothetical protein